MSVKSPSHITVALPDGVRPSLDMNEVLIRKFLKACKKENLQTTLDISSEVRRFESAHRKDKVKRKADKEKAIREHKKVNDPNFNDKLPKKKKKKVETGRKE
jgi:hypothetical protein